VVEAWNGGETLYFDAAMEDIAADEQDKYLDESPMAGPIREYLERLYPANWVEMDTAERRNFLHDKGDFGETIVGTEPKTKVCALEIWVELYKGDIGRLTNMQSREINDILKRTPGWGYPQNSKTGMMRFGNLYGKQRAFVKI